MKKIISALFLLMSIFSLAALKDGTYSVNGKTSGDWRAFLKITVKNEKIINVQYDRKNSNGQLLSMDGSGAGFRDAAFALARSLKNTQNVNTVENVNNAEITNEFKTMANFLIDKANAGAVGDFSL